jgi:hypothetical protein
VLLHRHWQVRDYLVALESHLSEAHRQASRLTAKEVELGEATLEFGQVRAAYMFVVDVSVFGPCTCVVDSGKALKQLLRNRAMSARHSANAEFGQVRAAYM